MLTCQNIYKAFGGVKALQGATLTIAPQRITALIGPNGAGKTTLFDIINGLIKPDKGEIFLKEESIAALYPHQRTQLGISRTWQQVHLFKHLTIKDHLRMAESNEDMKLFKNLFCLKRTQQKPYNSVLEKFGIDRPPQTIVSDLSYGQRKLLQMAMVYLQPHKLLLLDEPVAGVNQVVQDQIELLLPKLKEEGETICVIEHDMEFVKRVADHVICMDAGKVLVEGPPKEVLRDKRVLEAYLGE